MLLNVYRHRGRLRYPFNLILLFLFSFSLDHFFSPLACPRPITYVSRTAFYITVVVVSRLRQKAYIIPIHYIERAIRTLTRVKEDSERRRIFNNSKSNKSDTKNIFNFHVHIGSLETKVSGKILFLFSSRHHFHHLVYLIVVGNIYLISN